MSGQREDGQYTVNPGEVPHGPAGLEVLTAPAEGAAYRGVIVIEWPAPIGTGPYACMNGRQVTITDAVTGKAITTCSRAVITAGVGELITAELTLFAGADGEPVLDGEPVPGREEILTGTFPFLVSEMRGREAS